MATFLPEALKRFKENYPDFIPDNVRLIDANALKEAIDIESWFGEETSISIEALKKIIESAPTVETTDDVLVNNK